MTLYPDISPLTANSIIQNVFPLFIGAAIATLFTGIVNFLQHQVPVSRLLSRIALGRLAWKPVVAATLMAVYLALLGSQRIFVTIPSAGVIYAVVFFALTIWSMGGFHKFKAKYQFLWS